jgi:hypothetical protein
MRKGVALKPFQSVARARVVPYNLDEPVSTGGWTLRLQVQIFLGIMGSGRNYQLWVNGHPRGKVDSYDLTPKMT